VSMTKTNIAAASRIPSRGVPPPPSGVPIQRVSTLGPSVPADRLLDKLPESCHAWPWSHSWRWQRPNLSCSGT
jgi:hypothetical protein